MFYISANDYTDYAFDINADQLKKAMLGRSIREINPAKQTITLDNGVIVELQNASDCCAWYDVTGMEAFDFEENIITDVIRQDNDEIGDNFTFKILSRHKTIAEVSVDGYEGSGYYCHSINMGVKNPKVVADPNNVPLNKMGLEQNLVGKTVIDINTELMRILLADGSEITLHEDNRIINDGYLYRAKPNLVVGDYKLNQVTNVHQLNATELVDLSGGIIEYTFAIMSGNTVMMAIRVEGTSTLESHPTPRALVSYHL